MPELLLFQLHGPLASWGEPAVGEYRPSATHPGKSQIGGILGAALGLSREREEDLAALVSGYGLAVRIDSEGELLRDYHTTQVPPAKRKRRFLTRRDELAVPDLYTILSRRDYRVDAAWTCALWPYEAAPHDLATIAQALRRPRFTLYLGRKSCPPALPLAPQVIEAPTLKAAFSAYPGDEQLIVGLTGGGERLTEKRRYFWEEPLAEGLESGFEDTEILWKVPRRDQPISRRRWQFDTRDEHHAIA